jgi:hypothetical protein
MCSTPFRQTVTNRQMLGYALAAGSVQGSLFAFVFSSQQGSPKFTGLGIIFRWRSQSSRSFGRAVPNPNWSPNREVW